MFALKQAYIPYLVTAALSFLSAMPETVLSVSLTPEQGWHVRGGKARGGALEITTAKNLKLHWQPKHTAFFVMAPDPPIVLPELASTVDAIVSLSVYTENPEQITWLTLRLLDAQQRTFQWRIQPELTTGRDVPVRFVLQPDNATGVWTKTGELSRQTTPKPPMKLAAICVGVQQSPEKTGSIEFRQFDTTSQSTLLEQINVQVKSNFSIPIQTPKDKLITLTIAHRGDMPWHGQMDVTLRPFEGDPFKFSQKFNLSSGDTTTWTLPHLLDQQGVWWIDYVLTDDKRDAQHLGRASVAVMEPVGPNLETVPGFLFGLCDHNNWITPAQQQRNATAAGLLGAEAVRAGAVWRQIQPTQDQWDWSVMDNIVRLYEKQQIALSYLIAYTPKWATTGDPTSKSIQAWNRMPPKPDAWKTFIHTMAERYHGRIHMWEIWNEPNHLDFFRGSVDDYLTMRRAAWQTLKSIDPANQVLHGGLGRRRANVYTAMAEQQTETYDILAVHRHSDFSEFGPAMDHIWGALHQQVAPNKPLFVNEAGFVCKGTSLQSERKQAEQLVKKLTYAWSSGADGYFWYLIRDDRPVLYETQPNPGLLTYDYQPRPAFVAYNTLVKLLRQAQFDYRFHLGPNAYAIGFQDETNNRYILVCWTEQTDAPPTISLHADANAIHRVDLMNNRQTLSSIDAGKWAIPLSNRPIFLMLENYNRRPTLTLSNESQKVVMKDH